MAETNSLPLFTEDIYDALKGVVAALGGAKKAAELLWPKQNKERALLDCLNANNDRKFDPAEIMALLKFGRAVGYHQGKHWIDDALGYEPTPPKDPEVARDRLAEALERHARAGEELTRQAGLLLEQKRKN